MNDPIVSELLRIAQEHGGILRPEDVIEAAKDARSPLHDQFDWSDDVAAHKWRLHQARNLIRVCVRQIELPNGARTECRVWVSLTPDRALPGGGYRTMESVLVAQSLRQQLLADAMKEAEAFRTKYASLTELAEVHRAISRALSEWRRGLLATRRALAAD